MVRASSPRALVYNQEEFTHRSVIFSEADSLPEDGPAASAMRSLMTDREMSYEVVEKGLEPITGVDESNANGGFEGFEPIKGGTTHSTAQQEALQKQLPWDAYLEEVEDHEPQTR